jgi:hypothetical protein
MRRLVLLCAFVLAIGCAKQAAPPPEPPPAPPPSPDPYFVYRVEHDSDTLGEIARWYTGKYGNWQILTKPVNPDLTQCCSKLEIGREVKIPRHLVIRTDPMPAPQKAVSKPGKRTKDAKGKSLPKAAEERSGETEQPAASTDEPGGSEPAAPPPIIGPK